MISRIFPLLLLVCLAQAQRRHGRPHFQDDYDDDNVGAHNSVDNRGAGQFPFPKGNTPVFNFDQDLDLIATIPELIEALDKIKNVVGQQTKITQAFGEAFDQCESCG